MPVTTTTLGSTVLKETWSIVWPFVKSGIISRELMHLCLSQFQMMTLASDLALIVTSSFLASLLQKSADTNSLAESSFEQRILRFFNGTSKIDCYFFSTLSSRNLLTLYTVQIAFWPFSQTARNLRLGDRARAVMPWLPSIPGINLYIFSVM